MEPNTKFDASASKKNNFEKSICTRIGADVNAFLSASKPSLAFSFHINLFFSMKQVNGSAILE